MIRIIYYALALLLIVSSVGLAQTTTGRVVGTITDGTGAVIPGVEVVVKNTATGVTRTVITDETGSYSVPLLPAGVYAVEASLAGFRKEIRNGVTVQVDSVPRVNFSLQVGEVSNEVSVTADAPLIQSENASIGEVIDSKKVSELPLNKREFMALTVLMPGVQPVVEGSTLSTQQMSFHAMGAREGMNNFLLDGVDNNDPGNAQLVIVPSIDAIQEFKIQTSTYGAEFGRAGGGVVNIQTKSGGNIFHGTVFEFLRNDALDARNFFALKKDPYHRNQFGLVVSGPIIKNKTFFMFNYEGNRIRQKQSAVATVPTEAQRNGDFSALGRSIIDPQTGLPFPGNIIPSNRFDPTGKAFVDFFPLPNRTGSASNFVGSVGAIQDFDIYTGRIDHHFSDKHTIYGRLTWQDAFQTQPYSQSGSTLPGFGGVFFQPIGRNAMIGDTYVFGPRVVNEFRVGFNRLEGGIFEWLYGKDYAKELGITGVQSQIFPDPNGKNFGWPRVSFTGYTSMVGGFSNQQRYDNVWHFFDMVAVSRGKHQMKMGSEVRTQMLNVYLDSNSNGGFTFTGQYTGAANGVADALLGIPATTARQVGDAHDQNRNRSLNFFFQDDWKIRSNLTLNLGLRWEYQTPPVNAIGDMAFFDAKTGQVTIGGKSGTLVYPHPINKGQTISVVGGEPLGIPRGGYKSDMNDFGPRFGFAWSPMKTTVLRGGYGVFYNPIISAITHTYADQSYPFVIPQTFIGDARTPNITMKNPFPDALGSSSLVTRAIDPNIRDGYMQNWNLGIQTQVGSDTVLDVSYAGSKGTKLDTTRDLNQAPLGPGTVASRRPFQGFGSISQLEKSTGSNYQSLQGRFERRLSSGLTFITSYTFSHSIDISSGSTGTAGGGIQQNNNLQSERGRSVFDVRHRLVVSYSYELPFGSGRAFLGDVHGIAGMLVSGWQFSGISTFATGQAFTPQFSGDGSNTGITFVRPDRIKDGNLPRGERTPEHWIDTTAFVRAPAGTFGNAGRGILTAPGTNNTDFSLIKSTKVRENHNVQFRAEMFNIANHANFLVPVNVVDSLAFGSVTRAKDARQIQFGLKYNF